MRKSMGIMLQRSWGNIAYCIYITAFTINNTRFALFYCFYSLFCSKSLFAHVLHYTIDADVGGCVLYVVSFCLLSYNMNKYNVQDTRKKPFKQHKKKIIIRFYFQFSFFSAESRTKVKNETNIKYCDGKF